MLEDGKEVSIRASLQQRGEPIFFSISMSALFQSAPHFSSEANFHGAFTDDLTLAVSIRASLQQRGEHAT